MTPAPMTIAGKGAPKKKIAMKAAAAIARSRAVLQRAPADPLHRLEHDREDRALEAEEQSRDNAKWPKST